MVTVDPDIAATMFYNDCADETATWATERLRPQMLTWMGQRPREVAWRCKPSTYVICTNDQAIDPAQQREWARRCSNSVEWETGHSPFLSRPDLVVELVTEIVSAVAR
jgi:pimeloyl-ACP methyl ester carboxylesterase